MQGFVEFSEEKKIVIKTKMGGEIPGTIKVTGKDYHIVKSDVGGKQYKTDHQGNALTEELDDKDLPFTPDKKKTKPSTPGKYGDAYSTVRNLARRALEKQKHVKEDTEELDERSEQSRQNKIKKNVMDASRGAQYRIRTGLNVDPESTGHKTPQQFNKALGRALRNEDLEEAYDSPLDTPEQKKAREDLTKVLKDIKKTNPNHPATKDVKEEVELEEKAPVAPAPTVHRIGVTLSDPSHTFSTKRGETIQRFVRVHHHNDNKDEAIARGKKHFEKKGWKVHDAWHAGNLHEDLEEGYRGNSEADKPYWEAQDHKQAAEKARKSGDHFSYHKFMSAHHDSMAHWSNNKGRNRVADQHMNKSDEHEHYAQEIRKGAK